MKFYISKEVLEKYPSLRVGIILAKGIDNSKGVGEDILRQTEKSLADQSEEKTINDFPHISDWREAHKAFGNNPKRYAPSVLAVVKRVLKGDNLPNINSLVNLYNHISLKHIAPVGGEDLDTCEGDIRLDFAKGDEHFVSIGSGENEPPEAGEVVYKDDKGVLCRKFNWREADRTKLTDDTKNAILVIEALESMSDEELKQALDELSALVSEHCGGELESHIVRENEIEIN